MVPLRKALEMPSLSSKIVLPGMRRSHRLKDLTQGKSQGNLRIPVSSKIDKRRKLAICEAFGHVVGEDRPALQLEDPDFDPSFSQLLDLTEVTKVDVDAEVIRTPAQTSVFSLGARRAFVADNPVMFGFARMFEMLHETRGGAGVQVFRSRDEALRWLEGAE
jgi:hypothetical protein